MFISWYNHLYNHHKVNTLKFDKACIQQSAGSSLVQLVAWGILVNSSLSEQNGRHFPRGICKCIYMKDKLCILIWIPLKFIPTVPVDNIVALLQIMAWCRTGDKLLSETMLTRLTYALCGIRRRWGKIRLVSHGSFGTKVGCYQNTIFLFEWRPWAIHLEDRGNFVQTSICMWDRMAA